MDNTKKYISMCEKAIKIQRDHKPRRGDVYVCACNSCKRPNRGIYMIEACDIDCLNNRDLTNVEEHYAKTVKMSAYGSFVAYLRDRSKEYLSYIWLPYQDQLQGMLSKDVDNLSKRIFDWCEFTYPIMGGMDFEPSSMEQLWLAFVMKEKFNKTWDGEKWIC